MFMKWSGIDEYSYISQRPLVFSALFTIFDTWQRCISYYYNVRPLAQETHPVARRIYGLGISSLSFANLRGFLFDTSLFL